jgi:hypothetical protein
MVSRASHLRSLDALLAPETRVSIQRALRVVDDGMFNEVAQPFRDTFKSEAQAFLDAAKLVSRDASAADARRRQNEG